MGNADEHDERFAIYYFGTFHIILLILVGIGLYFGMPV